MLVLDETDGAFAYFMDDMPNGMSQGADLTCLSTHKSIGGMWGKSFVMNGKQSRVSNSKFYKAV